MVRLNGGKFACKICNDWEIEFTYMAQMISEIWEGLCAAGLTEVMLYLPDNSAARCHWRDTAVIAGVRVALIADQERKIVRIVPVDTCVGIGVASPKGVDPTGHRSVILNKIVHQFPQPPDRFAVTPEEPAVEHRPEREEQPTGEAVVAVPTLQMPATEDPAPTVAAPALGRFGTMTRHVDSKAHVPPAAGQGVSRPGDRGWKRA